MRVPSAFSILLILAFTACIDRIDFDIGDSSVVDVVIDGSISDQPGPYEVRLTRASDIQSKFSPRVSLSAQRLDISDNLGNSEQLTQTSQGIYRTNPAGIRGVVGRAYKLRVELLDGRIYESIPDTLLQSGKVDTIFHEYTELLFEDSVIRPGFNIFFNSSGGQASHNRFLWKFTGTYKIDTNPELYDTLCGEGRCPKPLPCSGYELDRLTGAVIYDGPCTCCTCWVDFFNNYPIVSDSYVVTDGQIRNVPAGFVIINQWTFMYRMHVLLQQMSLSTQAFAFWKAVKAQRDAITSLFQPVTGRVPSNFKQLSGPKATVQGIFFATSITSKAYYLSSNDFPKLFALPPVDPPIKNSCVRAFPNSSTTQPSFWLD